MLFNLDFADDIILLCFFFLFLITGLYFLIPAIITQIFYPIAELVIAIRITIKKAKVKMETRSIIAGISLSERSI